jgi:hypothetical protein
LAPKLQTTKNKLKNKQTKIKWIVTTTIITITISIAPLTQLRDKVWQSVTTGDNGWQRVTTATLFILNIININIIDARARAIQLDKILSTKEIKTFKSINTDNFIVTFVPVINKYICASHGLDFYKVNLNEKIIVGKDYGFKYTSIIISTFTTVYALIQMNQIKLDVITSGRIIYYSDTDSLPTNLSLNKLKEIMPKIIRDKLGQLKFEQYVQEAYFISKKTSAFLVEDGKVKIKAKGVSAASLYISNIKDMSLNSKYIKGDKTSSIISYSKCSVTINVSKFNINWNGYTTPPVWLGQEEYREKIYNTKTSIWTNTRPFYIYNLYPCAFVAASAPIRTKWKSNESIYLEVFVPKNIIIFNFTSSPCVYSQPKVIPETWLVKEQLLNYSPGYAYAYKNNNNNINKTATIPSRLRSAIFCSPPTKGGWVLWCFRWMSGKYSATVLSLSNCSINIIYLNIILLLGIVLFFCAPILIYMLTGVNIYDPNTITNSLYSMALFKLRICLATVFVHLLIYFCILNKKWLKSSIFNKPILWASSLIGTGGVEVLGDQELEAQHVTPKPMPPLNSNNGVFTNEDLLSFELWQAQNDSMGRNCTSTKPINPEVKGVPIPYPPGYQTAGPSRGCRPSFDSHSWDSSPPDTATSAGSSFEPASTSEGQKKVRFNDKDEVKEIPDSDSYKQEWNEEYKQMVDKNKKQKDLERALNTSDNSKPTDPETLNFCQRQKMYKENANKNWDRYYKNDRELENSQKIGSLDQKLETINTNTKIENSNSYHSVWKGTPTSNILKEIKRSKPSGSVVTSSPANIKGHINNQSSTSKQDMVSKLQDLNNKK